MEVLRRCPLAIAQRLVHCAIALSTAVLDRVTKTMFVAPLLMNNLDNSKQKTSNLLSPAPPPYSWSLLGKSEGPAPPPSSKISWSFDLAWNPDASCTLLHCSCIVFLFYFLVLRMLHQSLAVDSSSVLFSFLAVALTRCTLFYCSYISFLFSSAGCRMPNNNNNNNNNNNK